MPVAVILPNQFGFSKIQIDLEVKKVKTPRKVFILKKDEYIELTLQEHEALQKTMPGYLDKKFIFLHDCLMEVSENFYLDFYKDKRRQKYLPACMREDKNSRCGVETLVKGQTVVVAGKIKTTHTLTWKPLYIG